MGGRSSKTATLLGALFEHNVVGSVGQTVRAERAQLVLVATAFVLVGWPRVTRMMRADNAGQWSEARALLRLM